MNTYPDCIPCLVKQALDALRMVKAEDEVICRAMKRVLAEAAEFDMSKSPPEMARTTHKIIREETGNPDPYFKIKKHSTEEALKLEAMVREKIESSDNPLRSAVRFAIAGNVMDFAIFQWCQDRFMARLDEALHKEIDEEAMQAFESAAEKSGTILYLADNTGETVFDMLLLEQLAGKELVYAVKSAPAINDALREDALEAGIDKYAKIVENGWDAPGTVLDMCSPEFLEIYRSADMVISKGQGNFESLGEVEREVFFLTQIKCQVIARDLAGEIGDWVILHSGQSSQ